jgi:hypothetical protein
MIEPSVIFSQWLSFSLASEKIDHHSHRNPSSFFAIYQPVAQRLGVSEFLSCISETIPA